MLSRAIPSVLKTSLTSLQRLASLAPSAVFGQERRQVKGRERLLAQHTGRGEPLATALVSHLCGQPEAEPMVDPGIQEIDPDGDAGLSAGTEEAIAAPADGVSDLVLSGFAETPDKTLKGGDAQLVVGAIANRSECVVEGYEPFLRVSALGQSHALADQGGSAVF